MRNRILRAAPVTLQDGVTTMPIPSADEGSLASLESGDGFYPSRAVLTIDAAGTVTLSDAALYAKAEGVWRFIGLLNGGADIALTATAGYEQRFEPSGWTNVAVVATLSAAVEVTTNWVRESLL